MSFADSNASFGCSDFAGSDDAGGRATNAGGIAFPGEDGDGVKVLERSQAGPYDYVVLQGSEGAKLLKARGASDVIAAATHGIFASNALDLIEDSPISKVYITDSIPLPNGWQSKPVELVSIAPLLAEAIMRIHKDLSVSALFH